MVGEHEESTVGHNVWYLGIFFALCVLTGISVMLDLFHIQGAKIGGINVVLAALVLSVATAKALFVMMYFMHLKFEGKWKFLLLSPTIILAIGLPLALLPDMGVHYYILDVPQNTAKVSAEAHDVSEAAAEGHPREF